MGALLALALLQAVSPPATPAPTLASKVAYTEGIPVRIGDLASVRGVQSNQLSGWGLVVGLAGTGDTGNFTRQQVANLAVKLNINVQPQDLLANNVAIVNVSATLPPYSEQGQLIDCSVSSYGDAKSLVGGFLVRTPLYGAADGAAIAVAQGALILGGFSASGQAATVTRNHTTSGTLPNGALITLKGAELARMKPISEGNAIFLDLIHERAEVAERIAAAINTLRPGWATAVSPRTVRVSLPGDCTEESGKFNAALAEIQAVRVTPLTGPRVILNEKTSSVIITGTPCLGPCLIARGNLTVTIAESPIISQPLPFSSTGKTESAPRTDAKVVEESRPIAEIRGAATLRELTEALASLGATPRELVDILWQLKAAGALHAELEVH